MSDSKKSGSNTPGIIIGVDIGGSSTKICAFDGGRFIQPQYVRAGDPLASVYGALGKFLAANDIELSQIGRIMATGVGASFITKPLYNIRTDFVREFDAIGRGGLYLSGLGAAVIVSMGTGTAIVRAQDGRTSYLGGTGVGGGTILGLAKKLLDMESMEHIIALAADGDLSRVDLQIGDISQPESNIGLPERMTASNFGKVSDIATRADIALGIINLVFETVAMQSIFAARQFGTRDIILTGRLTRIPQSHRIFTELNALFDVNFLIPKLSEYATVIGAALGCETN